MRKKRALDVEKEEYWRAIFELFRESKMPFRKFCQQEKLNPNTFQYWRRELRKRDEASGVKSKIHKGENSPSQTDEKATYWLHIIQEVKRFRGGIKEYCRQNNIPSGTLYHWEKKLKARGLTRGFTEREKQGVMVPLRLANGSASELPESTDLLPERKSYVLPEKELAGQADLDSAERIHLSTADGMGISLPASTSIFFLVQFINGLRKHNC